MPLSRAFNADVSHQRNAMEETPRQTVGRYELRGELGRGGMGVVYRAFDPQLQREVAIKTLSEGPHASGELLARFCREAQATARLQHPGIVRVNEVGDVGDVHFIVMDLIDGKTLKARLKDGLSLAEAVGLLRQVAVALHHAHSHGVVHRDVKPGNIMVTSDGRAVIMDFGLARDLNDGSDLTSTGQTLGTPLYMAPEQVDSKYGTVSPATDVYALGAVLYRAACGQPPFNAYSSMILFKQILMDAPKPLRQVNPQLPAPLEAVVMRCLAKQPSQRYPSAAALAEDLQHFLAKRPISGTAPRRKRLTSSRRIAAVSPATPATAQRPLIATGVAGGLAILTALAWSLSSHDPAPPPGTAEVAVSAPNVEIKVLAPAEGLVSDQPEVKVEGEIQSGQAEHIWVGGVPLAVEDGKFQGQATLPRGASGYADGRYSLPFAASPDAEPLVQVAVILDSTEPSLEITTPPDGAVVGKGVIEVQGSVRDANLATLTRKSGEEVAVAEDGSFWLQVTLPQRDGHFEVTLVANDQAGNSSEAVAAVLVDHLPPQVQVSEPLPGTILSQRSVLLKGRVEDARPKGLWVDSKPVDLLEAGRFEARVALKTEGEQTILLEAEDANGLRSRPLTLTLTLDTTPPQLVVEASATALFSSTTLVRLRGRITDTHPPASVQVEERELPLGPDGHFMVELTLSEGTHLVELRCADQAGNPAHHLQTVICDTSPPALNIAPELPDYQWGRDRSLVVTGTVEEDDVSVTVNGQALTLSGRAFEATVPLQRGQNSIEVVVSDRAGNVSRETATVGYFRKEPKVPPGTWWTPPPEQLTYAKRRKLRLWFEGPLGLRFVLIPPGRFLMGSPLNERRRRDDEVPHVVTLTRAYYLSATQVTNAQLRAKYPRYSGGKWGDGNSLDEDDQPTIYTGWNTAAEFCAWLTKTSSKRLRFRLPTEAEWEYACRAGTTGPFFWGNDESQGIHYANVKGDADGHAVAAPVGSFKPNPWGLYDMLGNNIEWSRDFYTDKLSQDARDPQGPSDGTKRVARGGAFNHGLYDCRSARRWRFRPDDGKCSIRVLLEVEDD